MKQKILIIYTGGTIGMLKEPETGSLVPFDFNQITKFVPELKELGFEISAIAFEPPMDSANVNTLVWINLVMHIYDNHDFYDGFVILHGTDTMSFTASALSFMLSNLQKPVIFTGSMLPIGIIRTDGKENLITSVEMAAAQSDGRAIVPEVCIYFERNLFRGNRTIKNNTESFNAFRSYNYPSLATAGVNIVYNYPFIRIPDRSKNLHIFTKLSTDVALIKIFPGMSLDVIKSIFETHTLRAVVMETYGTGNATTDPRFLNLIREATKKGIIIMNITQCKQGKVEMGRYETSIELKNIGVVSGSDITAEAAVTKLMVLLGHSNDTNFIMKYLNTSISGEMTI